MADNIQFLAQRAAFDKQAEDYINQLLANSQGDRDLAIQMLTQDHNLAIGSQDSQSAAFLESISDQLEESIGRIPYDYEINIQRIEEDRLRTTEVATRNKDLALSRLAEDEGVWREQFGQDAAGLRQAEGESLSQRGLLTGKRAAAEGIAGRDVAQTEGDISSTLSTYDRALGRNRADITTQAEDTISGAERLALRGTADEQTIARRGVIDTQDQLAFGKEAEERRLKIRKEELQRKLTDLKLKSNTYGTQGIFNG